MTEFSEITLRCNSCGRHRPIMLINVHKIIDQEYPAITMNMRYCNDSWQCEQEIKKLTKLNEGHLFSENAHLHKKLAECNKERISYRRLSKTLLLLLSILLIYISILTFIK